MFRGPPHRHSVGVVEKVYVEVYVYARVMYAGVYAKNVCVCCSLLPPRPNPRAPCTSSTVIPRVQPGFDTSVTMLPCSGKTDTVWGESV